MMPFIGLTSSPIPKKVTNKICVEEKFLGVDDTLLILDDFFGSR